MAPTGAALSETNVAKQDLTPSTYRPTADDRDNLVAMTHVAKQDLTPDAFRNETFERRVPSTYNAQAWMKSC
jgi:hypothetical protein